MTQHEEAIASVIALSDFECIAIPYHICQRERQTNLVFMDKLAALLAQNLADSSADYAAASLNSGEQRLCSYILRASYQDVFRDVLTDVACSIGMSYRHMFRLLGQLCTDGILEKRKEGYYIAQPKALSAKAKNEC